MSDSRSSTGRRPNGQGSYFRRRGSWFVQVTGSDGTRSKPIKFPGDWTEEQVAAKTARLAALAAEATTGRTVGPLETTAAWFGRWFDDRAARGIVTAEKERGRFAKWAPSALRSKPIVERGRAILAELDATATLPREGAAPFYIRLADDLEVGS